MRAHPRACGENLFTVHVIRLETGSSPRMRGKRVHPAKKSEALGLIPAHAGKTSGFIFWNSVDRAHPRACGENQASSGARRPGRGSSPRMRGKRPVDSHHDIARGLIPAHAGKTEHPPSAHPAVWAHPRACGENAPLTGAQSPFAGSSPRMRGKLGDGQACDHASGLIPAHAGKTNTSSSSKLLSWAHPRACGENVSIHLTKRLFVGSSPRMRGKPARAPRSLISSGLIPAHAGKTVSSSARLSRRRAHPRACGENPNFLAIEVKSEGSSPRMRGKRFHRLGRGLGRRLIPAHAGKTSAKQPSTGPSRAHPRACGENTERSGVLALRSVRSWKTLSFPSSLKVTHCRAFVQLPFSRIRL